LAATRKLIFTIAPIVGLLGLTTLWHKSCANTVIERFNSAVFSSIASYSYPIIATSEKFLTGRVNLTEVYNISHAQDWIYRDNGGSIRRSSYQVNSSYKRDDVDLVDANYVDSSPFRLSQKASAGKLQRLDIQSCMSAYAQDFVTSRGVLVLILDLPEHDLNNSRSNASIFALTPNWSTHGNYDSDRVSVADNLPYYCHLPTTNSPDGVIGICMLGYATKMARMRVTTYTRTLRPRLVVRESPPFVQTPLIGDPWSKNTRSNTA
jgi:hypothetical protein